MVPYTARKMPCPADAVAISQMLAGIQTTGAPIGSTAIRPASAPSSTGRGTPAIISPTAVRMPWTSAVPRMP